MGKADSWTAVWQYIISNNLGRMVVCFQQLELYLLVLHAHAATFGLAKTRPD